jgi:cysteine protease ATG4
MLRCGQMVIAQALLFLHLGKSRSTLSRFRSGECRVARFVILNFAFLGREWRWTPLTQDKTYLKILRMFEDARCAPYSIHQIALMGASEGKQVGEWFGPNTVAQVLK